MAGTVYVSADAGVMPTMVITPAKNITVRLILYDGIDSDLIKDLSSSNQYAYFDVS